VVRATTHQGRSTTSRFRFACAAGLIGLALPAAPGQEGETKPPAKVESGPQVMRQVYAVRGALAKELASGLTSADLANLPRPPGRRGALRGRRLAPSLQVPARAVNELRYGALTGVYRRPFVVHGNLASAGTGSRSTA
jgi:hypothetical protein